MTGADGAVGAPSSGIEVDVVDTVPKTMQAKARRLMEHLKRVVAWTARGELIHEGVPVAGSNVVDLVNDLLRKRKTVSNRLAAICTKTPCHQPTYGVGR